MVIKSEIFDVECDEELPYIDEVIESLEYKIPSILDFFNITSYCKIKMKFWDDLDKYKSHISEYTEYKDEMCADTFDNMINILTLQAAHNTKTHKNQTLRGLKENAAHEFVHICQESLEQEKPDTENSNAWFYEALATNLGNPEQFKDIKFFYQTQEDLEDFNNMGEDRYNIVHTIGKYLLTNYSKEEILELVKHPKLLSLKTPEILSGAKDWVYYQILKQSIK